MPNFETITNKEKEILTNFEYNIHNLYYLEKDSLNLIRSIRRLMKDKNPKDNHKKIIEEIENFQNEHLSPYQLITKEKEEKDLIIEYERDKNKRFMNTENFLKKINTHLSSEKKSINDINGKSLRKINRAMINTKKSLEEEERGRELNEHIIWLLEEINRDCESISESIFSLNNTLETIKNVVQKFSYDKRKLNPKIKKYSKNLKEEIKKIKNNMRKLKRDGFTPLMDMVGKEENIDEMVNKYKKFGKITSDDIKADIYTMTEPEEIRRYISAIKQNPSLIEEEAWKHLENYAMKAEELISSKKKTSTTDGLTGLFTRKFMESKLDDLVESAHYNHGAFSFILMDIDHFKSVNDDLGHLVGDEILKNISFVIKRNIRGSDIACRYGGEEFVVICPRQDLENGKKVAEKLRKAIERTNFKLPDERKITVSVGVSCYGENDAYKKEDIIKLADKKLYRAKSRGRNRVISD